MTRKFLWRAALSVVLLAGVCAAQDAPAEEKTSRERWEEKLAALKKAGEPVKFSECAPPKVPDRENAAEVYTEAWYEWEALPEATRLRVDDLAGAREPWTEAETKEARKLLGEAADALGLLRQAASMKKCRFPLDYEGPAYAVLLPQLSRMQQFSRLMRFSARLQLADAKADAALVDCLTLVRMSRATEGEPILITRLVETAIRGVAAKAFEETLDRLEPSEKALREALAELRDLDDRKAYVQSMRGERCMGIELIEASVKDPGALKQVLGEEPTWADRVKGWFAGPVLYAAGLKYLDVMEDYVTLAAKPTHEVKDKVAALMDRIEKEKRNPNNMFVGILLPALEKAGLAYDGGIARMQCTRLALALRLYRMKHDAYPDKLDALVPDCFDKLPVDPFSGKGYLYRREGKGFVVYSVSGNGTDDGGADNRSIGEGDLVLRCSR
ncbi:MAG TPA: hypothetical protein VMX57_01385 [Planctomycetota bacterium]|nr:hypothetical protein [Planctomycetota bacterium]